MTAAERWAAQLAAWAIPEDIMAQAPVSPWEFSPALFTPPPQPPPDTPSRRRALEALPEGGTVLDVGCGGGAAGLALVPPAARVVGFDSSPQLLEVFARGAAGVGVDYEAVEGRWPDAADQAPAADVVVCNHVAYNVPDLGPFAAALSAHARRRVVVELTDRHPRFGLNHLWRHFWNLERPTGPTADDAVDVLVEAGIRPNVERAPRRPRTAAHADIVASARRYLCLPADRDPEIEALINEQSDWTGEVVTLWWDASEGGAGPVE